MPEQNNFAFREFARGLIGECRLFRGLSEARQEELAARAHVRAYGRGDTIFVMGDGGDRLMAVLDGPVRISMTSPDGREMVLAILGPGEVFGEITLFDGRERTADATARSLASATSVVPAYKIRRRRMPVCARRWAS